MAIPIILSCFFKDCDRPASPGNTKCVFHHRKGCCQEPNCRNQVYARHRCVQHGGRKQCQVFGCIGNARSRGLCSKHGSDVKKPVAAKCHEDWVFSAAQVDDIMLEPANDAEWDEYCWIETMDAILTDELCHGMQMGFKPLMMEVYGF
ncbi:Aste57867_8553 [Aphanomyces stellatus]|uniref:Aste57867_8553 protein n=1 Tax=Aphanomyces stellatus TaxID=120398 RepID=A0A485KKP6_9STRA|nr:hypothetical protein As57867_008521 [Aphanomyces stellatus]VFT85439.1 Aste57867_8553 [Aphanomyces stellatus]